MTDRVAALGGSWGRGTSGATVIHALVGTVTADGSTLWMDRTFVVNATPTPIRRRRVVRLVARDAAAIEKGDLGAYPVVNPTTQSGGGIVRNFAVNERERAAIPDAAPLQEFGGVPAHAATAE